MELSFFSLIVVISGSYSMLLSAIMPPLVAKYNFLPSSKKQSNILALIFFSNFNWAPD